MSARILFVDDEPHVLAALRRTVGDLWEVDTASSGPLALKSIRENPPYSAIVVDQRMPGLTGLEVLEEIARFSPNTTRIMLTGNLDQETAVGAVNAGHVFRYLNKPCGDRVLIETLTAAIAQYELLSSRQELLERTLSGSLAMLTDVLAMIDPVDFGHSKQVRDQARDLCAQAKYDNAWQIEVGAMLAHVGMVSVPVSIRSKMKQEQALSEADKEVLAKVPRVGYDLIRKIPYLQPVADIVLYQDKRFSGTGYPEDRVAGEAIPFGSRVIKALRDFDVLLKECGDPRQALKTMNLRRGWYDPRVLEDVFNAFAANAPHPAPKVCATTARCLRIGQVLATDLKGKDGRVLAEAGTEVTPVHLTLVSELANLDLIVEPIQVVA